MTMRRDKMATGKGRERDASVQHAMQQTRQAGVFDALVSTGARLEDSCWLEPGLGVASWCNRYDQTRYHKPGNHTISVYLQGGEQTERLDGPGGHGGAGKVCIMPDHHRSEWLVREEFRFFHLYFTPAHFTRIAEQACDKEGRHLQLEDKTFIDDPQAVALVQGQLMKLDWQHGIDRMALSHGAWMLMLHAYRHHTREAPGAAGSARRPGPGRGAPGAGVSAGSPGRAGHPGRTRPGGGSERIPLRPYVRAEPGLSAPPLPARAAAQAGQAVAGGKRASGQHRRPVRLLLPGPFW